MTQAENAKEATEEGKVEEENILSDYEIYLSQYNNGGFIESKGINAPLLGKDMELVLYNEATKKWEANNTGSSYDYISKEGEEDNTESRWANARVTIDEVESYFVWIPRFAYKINYTSSEDISAGGTIEIKFLKDTSNVAADGTICKYANDETLDKNKDYIIHPAFTSNVNLGGWRNELTGIWVGKYEVSRTDANITDEGTSTKLKVQPLMNSLKNNATMEDKYNYAKEYSTDMNSHMLKNSEWGAVAYLTYSQYGRNGHEIEVNDNSGYVTADEGIEVNPKQSSTGNVYGIYDLSGGAYEWVASYLMDGDFSYANSTFTNNTSNEFSTVYEGENISLNYIFGDATYETMGWNKDNTNFINYGGPFFVRGGYYNSGTNAGIFYSYDTNGSKSITNGTASFRLCLAI